jgi:hypothetical protein
LLGTLYMSSQRCSKQPKETGWQWLTSVILATQEAEIRRIGFKASLGK